MLWFSLAFGLLMVQALVGLAAGSVAWPLSIWRLAAFLTPPLVIIAYFQGLKTTAGFHRSAAAGSMASERTWRGLALLVWAYALLLVLVNVSNTWALALPDAVETAASDGVRVGSVLVWGMLAGLALLISRRGTMPGYGWLVAAFGAPALLYLINTSIGPAALFSEPLVKPLSGLWWPLQRLMTVVAWLGFLWPRASSRRRLPGAD
ncbi:MAG: hypothetical protein WD535_03685 [Thermaerobacterales bacterium]